MAGISIGEHGGRRTVDHSLPLVPFIDFLLCLVAFLLVTAIWSHLGRLQATASVPGASGETPEQPLTLHVALRDSAFQFTWRRGETVVDSATVPLVDEGSPQSGLGRYRGLSEAFATQLQQHVERAPQGPQRLVLHVPSDRDFDAIVGVLDAAASVRRPVTFAGQTHELPGYLVSLASE